MPVGEVRVGGRIETHRRDRVADVDQQAVSFTGATRQSERRVHRDVVALRTLATTTRRRATCRPGEHRVDRTLRHTAHRGAIGRVHRRTATRLHGVVQQRTKHLRRHHHVHARLRVLRDERAGGLRRRERLRRRFLVGIGQAMRRRGAQSSEDVGTTNHRGRGRVGERHLDDLDAQARRVRIVRRHVGATGEFAGRTDARRTRHVDVHVVLVLRILEHRVRV